jgi:hypothetical protein
MMGARQAAGSKISNGGGSSSSGWVIARRRPLNPPFWNNHLCPGEAAFEVPLSIIAAVVPSEKTLNCLKRKLAGAIDVLD